MLQASLNYQREVLAAFAEASHPRRNTWTIGRSTSHRLKTGQQNPATDSETVAAVEPDAELTSTAEVNDVGQRYYQPQPVSTGQSDADAAEIRAYLAAEQEAQVIICSIYIDHGCIFKVSF